MTSTRQCLVGLELHSERPGDSASFYAWLLGPGSGGEVHDWNPISLLFSHGVCGVHRVEPSGPRGWVPVLALDDLEEAARRLQADGGRVEEIEGRRYFVDEGGVWTRVAAADRLPLEVDPEALGATNADYYAPDTVQVAERWARRLGMERVEVVDEPDGLNWVVSGRRPAFGCVQYTSRLQAPLPCPSWVAYFAVKDVHLGTARAAEVGTEVAIAPLFEDYNDWCVLVDPFGTSFGLSLYYDLGTADVRVRTSRGEMALAEAVELPRA